MPDIVDDFIRKTNAKRRGESLPSEAPPAPSESDEESEGEESAADAIATFLAEQEDR